MNKNVLLLGMSTLPQTLIVNTYYYNKNGKRSDYYAYSQLEPITKMLYCNLKERGENLDKIVIMSSKEALEQIHPSVGCSAVEFYCQRIKEFVESRSVQENEDSKYYQGIAVSKHSKNAVSNEILDQQKTYLSKYSRDEESTIKGLEIEIVEISNKEEINIFFEVIDHIKSTGNDISLHLDMQGGDRNISAQMNAIVSLLKDQGVKTQSRYAIPYDRENIEHPINEVSKKYIAYQLISAMQAFKLYGRGQSLIDYFKNKQTARDNRVLKAIEKASDAIRLCDMDKFDEAVNEIALIKDTRDKENINENKTKTELDIVFEDITNDYGKLLDQNSGMYIAKVKWCLEKGFIQQALTIIESKIPEYLYERGIITVNLKEKIKGVTVEEIMKTHQKDNKKAYLTVKHYAVEQLIFYNREKTYKMNGLVRNANDLLSKTPEMNLKDTIPFNNDNVKYLIDKNYKYGDNAHALVQFLKLFWCLKQQRNNVNHGSNGQNRFSKEALEHHIRIFVELGEMLEVDPR